MSFTLQNGQVPTAVLVGSEKVAGTPLEFAAARELLKRHHYPPERIAEIEQNPETGPAGVFLFETWICACICGGAN